MTDIYAVMQDTNGAHEPEGLMSVWDNRREAQRESDRLCARDGYRDGSYHVVPIELNQTSEECVA